MPAAEREESRERARSSRGRGRSSSRGPTLPPSGATVAGDSPGSGRTLPLPQQRRLNRPSSSKSPARSSRSIGEVSMLESEAASAQGGLGRPAITIAFDGDGRAPAATPARSSTTALESEASLADMQAVRDVCGVPALIGDGAALASASSPHVAPPSIGHGACGRSDAGIACSSAGSLVESETGAASGVHRRELAAELGPRLVEGFGATPGGGHSGRVRLSQASPSSAGGASLSAAAMATEAGSQAVARNLIRDMGRTLLAQVTAGDEGARGAGQNAT